jgi:hypothetical protein
MAKRKDYNGTIHDVPPIIVAFFKFEEQHYQYLQDGRTREAFSPVYCLCGKQLKSSSYNTSNCIFLLIITMVLHYHYLLKLR